MELLIFNFDFISIVCACSRARAHLRRDIYVFNSEAGTLAIAAALAISGKTRAYMYSEDLR